MVRVGPVGRVCFRFVLDFVIVGVLFLVVFEGGIFVSVLCLYDFSFLTLLLNLVGLVLGYVFMCLCCLFSMLFLLFLVMFLVVDVLGFLCCFVFKSWDLLGRSLFWARPVG